MMYRGLSILGANSYESSCLHAPTATSIVLLLIFLLDAHFHMQIQWMSGNTAPLSPPPTHYSYWC